MSHDMTSLNPSSPNMPPTLSEAVENTLQEGLGKLFQDTEYTGVLVDWLHNKTGLNKWWVKLAVWLFALLVSKAAARAGSTAGRMAAGMFSWVFDRVPGSSRIAAALLKLDSVKAAEIEFSAVMSGRIAPRDAKLTEHLPPSLRAQFVTQVWLHRAVDRLEPQPFLDISYLPAETQENRFLYTARSVELLGRNQEMEALRTFLDSDTPFAWWVVEGPGGVGKSRLALELALRSAGGWRIGFLRSHQKFDWLEWKPAVPTAMIVDYADVMAEELGDLTRDLVARAAQGDLPHPVRLLLLVREEEPTFRYRFLGSGVRRAAIETARYGTPLRVSPLTDQARWDVLCSVVPANVSLPDREETLKKLATIDPQKRPLFAIFAGDAIRFGRNIHEWDAVALAEDVLGREEDLWDKAGATEKDMNLLALATMTSSLRTSQLTFLSSVIFPSADGVASPDAFDPHRYRAMVGTAVEDVLLPLLPDMLGELFVLNHLRPRFAGDIQRADTMRQTAWGVSPDGMASFLMRAVTDYPQSETIPLLDSPPPFTDDPAQRNSWAKATLILTTCYGEAGRFENARRVYRQLRALSEQYTGDAALSEWRAKAAYNFLTTCGSCGELNEAWEIYEDLRALSQANAGHAEMREVRMMGAYNLLTLWGSRGELDKAQEMYKDLREISRANMGDAAVREERAKGAYNLMTLCCNVGRVGEARVLYEELRTISEAHAEDAAVREMRAKGIPNLLDAYKSSDQVEDARALYEELRMLSETHAEDATVREARANGAGKFLIILDHAEQLDEARALYDELRALSDAYHEDTAVWERRAWAAFLLLGFYWSAERFNDSRAMYGELQMLSATHPGNAAVGEWQATGAYILLNTWQLNEARMLYEDLRTISAAHPGNATIRKLWSEGGGELVAGYAKADRIEEAKALYDELRALSEVYTEDVAVRNARANGILALLEAYQNREQFDNASALYDELRALSEAHAADGAVREVRAKGIVNLLEAYKSLEQVEEARSLYEELRTLSEVHAEDAAVREWRVKGALTFLSILLSEGRQVLGVYRVLEELQALFEAHPRDEVLSKALGHLFGPRKI
jgi:hypothetical protein